MRKLPIGPFSQIRSHMWIFSVSSCATLLMSWIQFWLLVNLYQQGIHHLNIIVTFSLIFTKITMKWRVAPLQLPTKYPQLSAVLIGQIETLTVSELWRFNANVGRRICIAFKFHVHCSSQPTQNE